MKRIVITESQLKKVRKTLLNEYHIPTPMVRQREYEDNINEIGSEKFSETKPLDNTKQGKTLRPAIAKLKGKNHIVIIDKDDNIVGYGPAVGNMDKDKDKDRICKIAKILIDDWEEEVNMNEVDQPDFDNIQPITFCTIK